MTKYLAIDLGGTAIKYGVTDEKMNFLTKGKVDSRTDSYEAFKEDLKKILDECGEGVEGMCISMPGMIDRIKGFAYTGGAYRWVKQIPLAMELKEEFGMPVTICNDAKAAALAELGFGHLQDVRNGIAIILGTGIGGAVVIEGKLLDGSHYSSGEFSFIQENKREKGKCMDIFAFSNGVQGLKNAIREASGLEDIDGLKAFKLIKEENNEQVLQGVKDFCWYLSYYIYNLQTILDRMPFGPLPPNFNPDAPPGTAAAGAGAAGGEDEVQLTEDEQRKAARDLADKYCKPGKPVMLGMPATRRATPAFQDELYRYSRQIYLDE